METIRNNLVSDVRQRVAEVVVGQDVVVALQYIAKGEGLLAGLAILFCAMVLDRIAQGRFKRQEVGS